MLLPVRNLFGWFPSLPIQSERASITFRSLLMPSSITKSKLNAFQEQNGRCYYCGCHMWLTDKESFAISSAISTSEAAKFQCTAEHLVARCDGGANRKSNIVAACRFCNGVRHRMKAPLAPGKYREHIQKRLVKGKWHPKSQQHLVTRPA